MGIVADIMKSLRESECPYDDCRHRFDLVANDPDWWDGLNGGDDFMTTCPSCKRELDASVDYEPRFSLSVPEEE